MGMNDLTWLLKKVGEGKDPKAQEELLEVVYNELRKKAHLEMAGERSEHTLQATVLVNDAWLKLYPAGSKVIFKNRAHFFGAAAEAMRRILVDHARKKLAIKRGVRPQLTQIATKHLADLPPGVDKVKMPDEEKMANELRVAVDDVLKEISKKDPETAKLVEMRFFLDMTMPDVAEMLGISLSSAERQYREFKKKYKNRFESLV